MLHDEVDRRAALSAGKALANVFSRRYVKRRTVIGMERTEADIIHTATAQGYELGDYLYDIASILDAVYGGAIYHFLFILVWTNIPYFF
jgi:hypothetical protein